MEELRLWRTLEKLNPGVTLPPRRWVSLALVGRVRGGKALPPKTLMVLEDEEIEAALGRKWEDLPEGPVGVRLRLEFLPEEAGGERG